MTDSGSTASPARGAAGIRGAKALEEESVDLVRQWLARAARLHRRPDPSSRRLAQLLKDPQGPSFALGFVDRVMSPEDLRVAAGNLRALATEPPRFLSWPLRALLRTAGVWALVFPAIVVPLARAFLRSLVGHLIIDADDNSLGTSLRRVGRRGDQLNINLLGEAVLGHREADQRLEGVRRLIDRPDVTYVSVKVSSIAAQLSTWSFDDTVERIVERLVPLYQQAASQPTPTFINLDMEEYKDLHLTLEVFERVLSRESLKDYRAGIVLQAYLPDALDAMKRLHAFAEARVKRGGAPIKVRVVKGANLYMERVDAIWHGWPVAVLPSKLETDTNYKRVLEWAMTPARTHSVHLGVAGHNLFDIALAHLMATKRGVQDAVDFEMLIGMAPDQAHAVRETVGPLVLYTPVVHNDEFMAAVGYLVRRLEENASEDNFMSAVFDLGASEAAFRREEQRFRESLRAISPKAPERRRSQNRRDESLAKRPKYGDPFVNEPDTDISVPENQQWAKGILAASTTKPSLTRGAKTLKAGAIPDTVSPIEGHIAIDDVVAKLRAGGAAWARRSASARGKILFQAADQLALARADLLTVMVQEAGKTLAEGDPEVSEAIDFARYYATRAAELETVAEAVFTPVRLTVIAPPWNFPVAIPTGSVTAALAAGSAVIIKPAPQVKRCAAVMVEALWEAGVPKDVLQLVDVSEGDLGRALFTHPGVDRIILTGGFETATLFRRWRADLPILGETSGKNAIVVTPSADEDLAVADVVKSAFGHAGQKCSAASLLILVGSLAHSKRFERQLLDAVSSLVVDYPTNPQAVMGPLIEAPGAKLARGLGELGSREKWLLEPRPLDDTGRLWSPGVRTGVAPGSDFHQTEFFGPILGIMHARTLQEAIDWQNQVDYGLTAGLHSLDPAEVEYWLDRVEAGNLYVNRGITGAIVQRQPFGGWKKSTVGPTHKAGGPNYLFALGSWEPREDTEAPSSPLAHDMAGVLTRLLELEPSEARTFLATALASDERAWREHYGISQDLSSLGVERNVLRYRPADVTIRLSPLVPWWQGVRVLLAARRAGATVQLSSAEPLPESVVTALRAPHQSWPGLLSYVVESELHFVDRVKTAPPARIRLVGGNRNALLVHFDGNPAVAVWADPVTASGRVEMLPFLREQAVSLSAHRFGAIDSRMAELAI